MEDENSETGFRKMTMEEELSRLDRAFQKMADRADAKEMIEGVFHGSVSDSSQFPPAKRKPSPHCPPSAAVHLFPFPVR